MNLKDINILKLYKLTGCVNFIDLSFKIYIFKIFLNFINLFITFYIYVFIYLIFLSI